MIVRRILHLGVRQGPHTLEVGEEVLLDAPDQVGLDTGREESMVFCHRLQLVHGHVTKHEMFAKPRNGLGVLVGVRARTHACTRAGGGPIWWKAVPHMEIPVKPGVCGGVPLVAVSVRSGKALASAETGPEVARKTARPYWSRGKAHADEHHDDA